MPTMNIFDVEENIAQFKNKQNNEELSSIIEAFKRGHFTHVLAQVKKFQEKHVVEANLAHALAIVKATCHAQIGEGKQARNLIRNMYENAKEQSLDLLIFYGNLAFMCDYKLTRKIMSDVVKRMEKEESIELTKAAHVYFVLGEAEENLEKFPRAIKYYQNCLSYMEENENEMHLFLHYKLGALHSLNRETDKAIEYLYKSYELSKDKNLEITVNSLVSLGKMYGSKKEYEKANTYIKEALPLFEGSPLENKFVHAEAYTELAYNYFDQAKYDVAVFYYEKAIELHRQLPPYSRRKLGMIYMQYAYCLEHQDETNKLLASIHYEKAIVELEKANDPELLESALGDTIAFFDKIGNKKKKRFYENKFVKVTNERARTN